MLNTVDYVLSESEVPKYNGKLAGKTVELAWNKIRANFGGRLPLEGGIAHKNQHNAGDRKNARPHAPTFF